MPVAHAGHHPGADQGVPGGCHVEDLEKPVDEDALRQSSLAIMAISGMGCPTCATRVRNGLLERPGVVRVIVRLEKGLAWVNFDSAAVTPEGLAEAVSRAGRASKHVYRGVVVDTLA